MKKLGVYVGDTHGGNLVKDNTFVWYEVIQHLSPTVGGDVYEVSIWSLKGGYPNGRMCDIRFKTTNPKIINDTVIPMKDVRDKYCIEWENQQWQIKEFEFYYNCHRDYEGITTLKVDQFGPNNSCHWEWEGERAFSVLKDATVNRIYKKQNLTFTDIYPTVPIPDIITEKLKKSLEQDVMKSALNSCYGRGGFTTIPRLSPEEIGKMFDSKNKETETMEKKKMTQTDLFLKDIDSITITSTYTKLDCGCGQPYYIYYPEMEITEDIADILLTVLLMAKKDFIRKVVFNPEKGTTMLYRNFDKCTITVRCRDGEFDYILGYNMARSKMYIGTDDYNWFNKIKNHRKTHIEYTEKKPTKKGGKK